VSIPKMGTLEVNYIESYTNGINATGERNDEWIKSALKAWSEDDMKLHDHDKLCKDIMAMTLDDMRTELALWIIRW